MTFARSFLRSAARVAKGPAARRAFSTGARAAAASARPTGYKLAAGGVAAAAALGFGFGAVTAFAAEPKVDFAAVRKDIAAILDEDNYDDGSIGPLLVRLAWHASGTYDVTTKTGGSDGATMRFTPEAAHGANAGLAEARKRLEKIAAKHTGLSYSDLWILASVVAIKEMGGPDIPFHAGRVDRPSGEWCTPDGRLPDADKGTKPGTIAHIRQIFYCMGMNDQEIVALFGAHALGRCHTDRSGYDGPWTRAPTTMSNEYYRLLVETKWVKKAWKGPVQYENTDGADLMMLPTDMALIEDPEFKKWVDVYAKDEKKFFADFSKAFQKLTENGCRNLEGLKGWF
ncbi:heme peroxidase [Baffinella frigidus]|nr:heme peroxidase [Cryptophyta sp. CCMP2293]